jgi:hypothetical protein
MTNQKRFCLWKDDVVFIPTIVSTSGRLHSEFVRLLFLQTHRETDLFFPTSGVQLEESTSVQFHYKHVVFSSQMKSKVGNILAKAAALWITLNIDVQRNPHCCSLDPRPLPFPHFTNTWEQSFHAFFVF